MEKRYIYIYIYIYGWISQPRFNPPMAGEEAGFPSFSHKCEEFLQTKLIPVGSSLGHLSMKKIFKSDLLSWL